MIEVAGCVNIPLIRLQILLDVCQRQFREDDIESDLEKEIVKLYNDFYRDGDAMAPISDKKEYSND